jgi:WxL domain surface cell wall-binding
MGMRRSVRMLAVLAFLTGSLAPVLIALTPGTASASPCGTALTSCSMTGTLNLTSGTLTLTTSTSLTWTDTLNGLDQNVVDTTADDQQYTVDDATGSGAGWHVTMSATTFTNGSSTLSDSGTLSTNGSATSSSATSAPTASCGTSVTCTLPTDSTTYPVTITTAASSPMVYTIYETAASTGMGQVVIGGTPNPVGWWLYIPANFVGTGGSYTSTITLAVVSAP